MKLACFLDMGQLGGITCGLGELLHGRKLLVQMMFVDMGKAGFTLQTGQRLRRRKEVQLSISVEQFLVREAE